jgi:hypothetical protein
MKKMNQGMPSSDASETPSVFHLLTVVDSDAKETALVFGL